MESRTAQVSLTTSTKRKRSKKVKNLKKKRTAEVSDSVTDAELGYAVDKDEELSEGSDDNISVSGELIKDDDSRYLDFDIEAFPMEADDRDGIVNMLTQIFLKADVDLVSVADALIAQSPFGIVIGPAEDQSDEDNENVVYGLLSMARLHNPKGGTPAYAQGIMHFLEEKSRKFALKDFWSAFSMTKTSRSGLFLNERMLNFPSQIVTPSFKSFKDDLSKLKKPYETVVYVHKLRIADCDAAPSTIKTKEEEPARKKKKMGKAEKKRMALHARSLADVIYDNTEDELLTQIKEGEAQYFDYPVHSEVDSGSKFHILVKNGKSYKPYRRVVVMDSKRFNVFLEQVINTSF